MADGDAAVDGLDVDCGPATAKVGVEPVLDLSLNGDGKVDADAAVDGAGFKVRGVVVGDTEVDAAVGGIGVEPVALPAVTGERDIEAAVDGVALDSRRKAGRG